MVGTRQKYRTCTNWLVFITTVLASVVCAFKITVAFVPVWAALLAVLAALRLACVLMALVPILAGIAASAAGLALITTLLADARDWFQSRGAW